MAEAPIMLVTGGSRGIGAAIARLAGERGYDVCVNYVAAAGRAEEVARAVRECGRRAIAAQADVSQPGDVERLFAETDRQLGAVDVVVNNAGMSIETPIADHEIADIRRIIDTNLLGPVMVCRQAIRRMARGRGGRGGVIVNISSISGVYGGLPGDVVYAGTKGGLDSFTLGLAKEVAPEGIRVCCIRPGLIRTEIWGDGMGQTALASSVTVELPFTRNRASSSATCRTARSAGISDESKGVTGYSLSGDGKTAFLTVPRQTVSRRKLQEFVSQERGGRHGQARRALGPRRRSGRDRDGRAVAGQRRGELCHRGRPQRLRRPRDLRARRGLTFLGRTAKDSGEGLCSCSFPVTPVRTTAGGLTWLNVPTTLRLLTPLGTCPPGKLAPSTVDFRSGPPRGYSFQERLAETGLRLSPVVDSSHAPAPRCSRRRSNHRRRFDRRVSEKCGAEKSRRLCALPWRLDVRNLVPRGLGGGCCRNRGADQARTDARSARSKAAGSVQRPLNAGLRFSAKARGPSFASSLASMRA